MSNLGDITVDSLRIEDRSGVGVSFTVEGSRLVIDADQAVQGIDIKVPGGELKLDINTTARMAADRIELHARSVLRTDANGTGYTFTASRWDYYLPFAGAGWKPSPPEHPDTGGEPYAYPQDTVISPP